MSKALHLVLLLLAVLLMALCQVQAQAWFADESTLRIAQAGVLLGYFLLARLGFAFQLLSFSRPVDKKQEESERVFWRLRNEHRRHRQPWLLVTGQAQTVEALLPGLTSERWQRSLSATLLWCGEPGSIAQEDIALFRRLRGRRALNAVLWVTDITPPSGMARLLGLENSRPDEFNDGVMRTLWQQLRDIARTLSWRPPLYALCVRDSVHDQYDRSRQSVGIVLSPAQETDIQAQLHTLLPQLTGQGMAQLSLQPRWNWLLQVSHDIQHATGGRIATALQPFVRRGSEIPLCGLFFMPPALPGQYMGQHACSLSAAWSEPVAQIRHARGERDHLIAGDWLVRGTVAFLGLWGAGMLLSALFNYRLVQADMALLLPEKKARPVAEQVRQQQERQARMDTLLYRSREGAPWWYRFGLNQNDALLKAMWPVWQQQNQTLLVAPLAEQLRSHLRQYMALPPGSAQRRTLATETYRQLKAYLMLTQPERAEPELLKKVLLPLWQNPARGITPGEWMMISSDMLDFYTRELPAHPAWRLPADSAMIANVRTLLRSQKGIQNSENTLYQQVLQQVAQRHADITLNDLLGDAGSGDLFYSNASLPGMFTREAWRQDVRETIDQVAAGRQIHTDWVLDDTGRTSPVLSEEALRTRLAERYFTDYSNAWLEFLNSLRWRQADSLSSAIDQLTLLGDVQRSPLVALGKTLRWQAGIGQEETTMGTSLLESVKQRVSGQDSTDARTAKTADPASVVTQTFAPLLAVLPPDENQPGQTKNSATPVSGLTLQDYLIQVTQARLSLRQVSTSPDPQAMTLALAQDAFSRRDNPLTVARSQGELLAASLGQDWSGFADAAFVQPLAQAWQSVLAPAQQAMNDAWRTQVVQPWQDAFSGRYPFVSSENDASPALLAHFIAPQQGVTEQFLRQQLGGLLDKQGDVWVPSALNSQGMAFNPAFLDAVNLLTQLGQAFFMQGELHTEFDIQMYPMRNVVETDLQIDNAMMKYFNQQAEWQTFTWPDKQSAQPQAMLSYSRNQGENIGPVRIAFQADGPWALLRLLEKAQREQTDSGRWRLSWPAEDGVGLSLNLRAQRYNGPLDLLKLRRFKLPEQVFIQDDRGNDDGR